MTVQCSRSRRQRRRNQGGVGSRYAIVVFPRLEKSAEIERVRRELDPLVGLIAAHITLVFPFDCALAPNQLRDHALAAIEGVTPFAITLSEPTAAHDGYLFLDVRDGSQQLSLLHRRLYAGPLAQHLSRSHKYEPHVTVGHLATQAERAGALQRAAALLGKSLDGSVDSIAVFRLDGGSGTVVFTLPFA